MEWWATTIVIGSGALTLFNVIDKVAPDNAYEHLIKSLKVVRDKLAPKV